VKLGLYISLDYTCSVHTFNSVLYNHFVIIFVTQHVSASLNNLPMCHIILT
jgi:hypothetical protein